MTKTQKLLEDCREKLDGVTDYALAKKLEIPRARVSEYVRGIQNADAYAAARMALLLGRDPLEVIAEIEAESATTEAKRSFWASFHSGLTQTLYGGALLLIGGSSLIGQTGSAEAGPLAASHNGRLRPKARAESRPKGGFFCLEFPSQSRRKSRCSATMKLWHGIG